MDKLFLSILNMSITGAFVIAAICLVRLPLKKAPKLISYCLWAVVGFRLAVPFSINSIVSLIPFKAAPIPRDIAMQAIPRIDSGITVIDNTVSAVLPAATPYYSVNPLQIWSFIGALLWLTGAAIMLIYGVVSYFLLKRKMRAAMFIEEDIYEAKNIRSPFLLGVFRPKIYLPAGLAEQERNYVILHEKIHIRRHDYIIKFIAYFILCLHWFNPFAWMAFILMGSDMELSCDEQAIKELGGEVKRDYSLTLLSLATERRSIGGSPLAFGEGGIKERVKNVLNFKRHSRIVIVTAIALAAVLSAGFAVNRAGTADNSKAEFQRVTLAADEQYNHINEALSCHNITFDKISISNNPFLAGMDQVWAAYDLTNNDGTTYVLILSKAGDYYVALLDSTGHIIDGLIDNGVTPALFKDGKYIYDTASPASNAGPSDSKFPTFSVSGTPDPYSPLMSSTPGMRLDFTISVPYDTLILKANAGGFLQWENSTITNLGNDITLQTDSPAIYWSGSQEDEISVCFMDKNGSEICGGTYYVTLKQPAYFSLKAGPAVVAVAAVSSPFPDITSTPSPTPTLEPAASYGKTNVSLVEANWTADQSIGADMARLDYASGEYVIFHGYFGLFVYDLRAQKIIRSIDLSAIGCGATQGDNYCQVAVSADGGKVWLHPASQNIMYVYDLTAEPSIPKLYETEYQWPAPDTCFHTINTETAVPNMNAGYSYSAVKFETGSVLYGYLYTSDWTLGTLEYIVGDKVYSLFKTGESVFIHRGDS